MHSENLNGNCRWGVQCTFLNSPETKKLFRCKNAACRSLYHHLCAAKLAPESAEDSICGVCTMEANFTGSGAAAKGVASVGSRQVSHGQFIGSWMQPVRFYHSCFLAGVLGTTAKAAAVLAGNIIPTSGAATRPSSVSSSQVEMSSSRLGHRAAGDRAGGTTGKTQKSKKPGEAHTRGVY